MSLIHRDWFKLKDTFRTDHFLVRNDHGDPLRTIYLSNAIIKVSQTGTDAGLELTKQAVLSNNDPSRLRIVSAGVKGFVRQDSQSRTDIACKWRVPNEGMLEVLPHVSEGVVKEVTLRELKVFVGENYPTVCHSR
jgi:multisite-specific tRNA:(cytosine-C5)-methyltransferase